MFLSGEDIYRNFTEAPGGAGLAGAAEMVKQLVGEYEQQSDEIIELTKAMESGWRGDAAGAAQRGAGPLAVAHALAAPEIDKAQDLSVRQVGSFGDAKNAVRPVPPEPTAPDPWSMVFSPDVSATYAGQMAAHNTASQHNVDVMSGYENASAFNTSGLPSSYGTLAADNASVTISSPDNGPITPPSPPPGPGQGGRSQTGDKNIRPDTHALDQPGTGGGSSGGGPISGGGSDGPSQPDLGDRLGGDTSPPPRTDPGGYQPPPVGGGGPGTPGGGLLPPGGTPVPDRQGGSGLGVGVISPVGGLGTGGGLGAGAGVGGGRGGVGPIGGGVPGESIATRAGGAAGARGGPGGLPAAAAGAGKGQGAEDEEHERASFLQEPDPEATFGTDEQTAPPVIQ